VTATRTATGGGAQKTDDDSCQIRPAAGGDGLRAWLLLLAPAAIAWRRSRKR
jgi:hypothetical protein